MTGQPTEQPMFTTEPPQAFWRSRLAAVADQYMSVPLAKLPEDLRLYEHILWQTTPTVIVEIGVQYGGSALWFRDRLEDLRRYLPGPKPLVIGVDLDTSLALTNIQKAPEGIHLIEGDITSSAVATKVVQLVEPHSGVLVVDDGAHTYDSTLSALEVLAPLVRPGDFYVVEDTVVDVEALRVSPGWPRGAGRAVEDWLRTPTGSAFRRRRDMERYGVTCQPGGYLQRVQAGSNTEGRTASRSQPDLLSIRRHLAVAIGRTATALRMLEGRLDPGGDRRTPRLPPG